jgi:dolichol-phosphate mannosyltransferase
MDFSIVIPLYNEEGIISLLIKEIENSLNKKEYVYEIILINDASTDLTSSELEKLKYIYPNKIRILNNKKNSGQSFSLRKGIEVSAYSNIITIDGDGQNNPSDIPKLMEIYFKDNNLSLVGGIRNKRQDSFIKIFSSKIANFIRRIILKDGCKDTGCSLKIFDKEVFLEFEYFDGIHRFLPALFSGYGKKTFFINVDHRPRKWGVSKYGTFGRLFNGIRDLIKVRNMIFSFKKNNV